MRATTIRRGALTVLCAAVVPLTACTGTDSGDGGAQEPPAESPESSPAEMESGDERAQSDIEYNENESSSDIERQVSEALSELGAETRDGDTVITLPDQVLFDTDEDTLHSDAESTLDDLAKAVTHFEDAPVTVDGHTDSEGSKSYNQDLSERRADSVADYLSENGVDESRITSEGHGETAPVASNDDEDGRAENRRVEVVIEGVDFDTELED